MHAHRLHALPPARNPRPVHSVHPPALEQFGVQRISLLNEPFKAEMFAHVTVSTACQPASKFRISQQSQQRAAKRIAILRWDKQPGYSILDDLGISSNIGHNGRK